MTESDKNEKKIKFKIGILGDTNTGKSTFINNFINSSGDTNVIQSKILFYFILFLK
jgi:GTPase SAR1 family protein